MRKLTIGSSFRIPINFLINLKSAKRTYPTYFLSKLLTVCFLLFNLLLPCEVLLIIEKVPVNLLQTKYLLQTH